MDLDNLTNPPRGKVLLYTSKDKSAEPMMTMMADVGNQLKPVLKKLAGKYSPIRSKHISLSCQFLY